MRRSLSISLPWDLAALVDKEIERRGLSRTELVEEAIRVYLSAPEEGEIHVFVEPRWAKEVQDVAARFGREPWEVVEAVLRRGVTRLTEEQIDPEIRKLKAKQKAKELLGE